MDLDHAARAPKPEQARRTHAPRPNQITEARCGARLAGVVVVEDGAPDLTTCLGCRADLVRDGILVDRRKGPRS